MDPKHLKRGDNCPRCGANAFMATRGPTDAQYAKAFDRENPTGLPEGFDTASPDFRKEHGELYECVKCGYKTRFPAEEPATEQPRQPRAVGGATEQQQQPPPPPQNNANQPNDHTNNAGGNQSTGNAAGNQ